MGKYIKSVFSLGLLMVILSCSGTNTETVEYKRAYPKIVSNRPSLAALQRPVMKADMSLLSGEGRKQKFSLVLRDAPLGEVLRTIARQAGYNIVFGKDVPVNEPVNVELKRVSLAAALDILSKMADFAYVIDGNTIWVVKGQIDTEIFKLDIPNMARMMKLSSSISTGQEGEESSGGGFSTDVEVASSFNLWMDIGCNVCVLVGLSCGGGSSKRTLGSSNVVQLCSDGERFVAVNRSTAHMIVTAEKERLKKVEDYVALVKSSLDKQVVLDVKIAEVELTRGLQLGVDWNKVFGNIFQSHYSVTFGQVSTPVSELQPVPNFFSMGVEARPGARDPFSLAIRALEKYGKVRVLSAPRIAVLNNQGAVIKVGNDLHFVTDVSSTTNTETNTIGCDVDTDTFFVGVSLSLIPYVDETGVVTMFVHPNITELRDVRTFRSECGDVPVEEPEFSVREMDTVVKVRDGDTLIIGGLIKSNAKSSTYKTPLLGDVPGLGYLFSRRETERTRTELFIFITPHVIYSPHPEKRALGLRTGSVDVVGR